MSRQLRAAGDITTLESAIKRARLLLSTDSDYNIAAVASETPIANTRSNEMDSLKEQIAALTVQVAAMEQPAAQLGNAMFELQPYRTLTMRMPITGVTILG